jgi:P-type Cu+ transporter
LEHADLIAGRYMEAYSKSRTADAITSLGKLRPSEAYIVVPAADNPQQGYRSPDDDVEKADLLSEDLSETNLHFNVKKISAELLEIGDIVRVQSGSSPPADGRIISGQTSFNESSLTGESRLVRKGVGDQVYLGTINTSHVVDIKVDAVGGETMYVLHSAVSTSWLIAEITGSITSLGLSEMDKPNARQLNELPTC